MTNKFYHAILQWLKSTEMFVRPSKQLPGKWELFEYYIESSEELHNIKETQLKANNEFWQISKVKSGSWSISKNFITLTSSENNKNYIEFQFAIEKETLKILKKDALGRIEFFGFFNRVV